MFNFSAFIPGSFLWTGCLCTVPGVSRLIGRGVVGSLVPIMDCPLSDPEDIFLDNILAVWLLCKLSWIQLMLWLFVRLLNGKLLANDVTTISRGADGRA